MPIIIDKEYCAVFRARTRVKTAADNLIRFKEELMKIGEASRIYSAQMSKLRDKRNELLEQKKALEKGEIEMTDKEVAALGKAIDRVDIQYEKASEIMGNINEQKNLLYNAEASKRQGDAMAEKAENDAKCLEIARRIARGDKVPPKDEQKLLEFNSDMYQMAKNMAAMVKNEKRKEHDSLWDDEDENQQPEKSIDEVVDNMECGMTMPAEIASDTDFVE